LKEEKSRGGGDGGGRGKRWKSGEKREMMTRGEEDGGGRQGKKYCEAGR